jgi:hypothetical protein
MQDPELQASVERINDRALWTWGWFFCGIVTLLAITQIAMDWHLRHSIGKITGVSLVVFLIAWPANVGISLKRRRRLSSGSLFIGAYFLLMLAIEAFGPLARAN